MAPWLLWYRHAAFWGLAGMSILAGPPSIPARRLRRAWIQGLTRTADLYVRSPLFLACMRGKFVADSRERRLR